jgi:hypothetical protein
MSAGSTWLAILGIAFCLWFVAWRAKRQLTLFVIRIDAGRIVDVKGRMPQRLLSDIADVVQLERRRELRIICRLEGGQARTAVYGDTDPGFEQMLRNLVGEYPVLRLKQAPRAKRVEASE